MEGSELDVIGLGRELDVTKPAAYNMSLENAQTAVLRQRVRDHFPGGIQSDALKTWLSDLGFKCNASAPRNSPPLNMSEGIRERCTFTDAKRFYGPGNRPEDVMIGRTYGWNIEVRVDQNHIANDVDVFVVAVDFPL
jgi:hypothetical protein